MLSISTIYFINFIYVCTSCLFINEKKIFELSFNFSHKDRLRSSKGASFFFFKCLFGCKTYYEKGKSDFRFPPFCHCLSVPRLPLFFLFSAFPPFQSFFQYICFFCCSLTNNVDDNTRVILGSINQIV